jgi:hypothetical protein
MILDRYQKLLAAGSEQHFVNAIVGKYPGCASDTLWGFMMVSPV